MVEEPCAPLLLPGQWCTLQAGPPQQPATAGPSMTHWEAALCTPLALLPPLRARAATADGRLNAKLARMAHAQLHPYGLQRTAAFQAHGPRELLLLEAAGVLQARYGGGLFLTPKVCRGCVLKCR